MRKIMLVMMAAMFMCIGTGCNDNKTDNDETNIVEPSITTYGTGEYARKGNYSYVVDDNTGVVYLAYDAYYRHGITVMLNADGTPVTADQLGLE